ncbi:MAG: D-alanyl-D-alanine carboxypeptidase [Candidatus Omnitrophica bacterium]|nr:D-alanyl-D-alanine carboxypeptidase [Candidatus Omnitrophota bacterium]
MRKILSFFLAAMFFFSVSAAFAAPGLTAKSAVILDARTGRILYGKNPHLKLPPASTTKLMTVLVVLERLPLDKPVTVSASAANTSPSKAGLARGVSYRAGDLVAACLISSSNDAAIALAEAVAGSEKEFVNLMNQKAKALGMNDTYFVNATGLTDKHARQVTTAYDLSRLMCQAIRDARVDRILGIPTAVITGSDRKPILIRNHNKMLWRMPRFVKGKTGWTFASRHTFVGTDYSADKRITFAMLSSQKPWMDIKWLAILGLALQSRR